jgi:hypothetical protein
MKLWFNPDGNTVEEVKELARLVRDLCIKNETLEKWLADGTIESEEKANEMFRDAFRGFTRDMEW